jgi:hypothetical protein
VEKRAWSKLQRCEARSVSILVKARTGCRKIDLIDLQRVPQPVVDLPTAEEFFMPGAHGELLPNTDFLLEAALSTEGRLTEAQVLHILH